MTPTETNKLVDDLIMENMRLTGDVSDLKSENKILKEQIKIDELLLSIREVD